MALNCGNINEWATLRRALLKARQSAAVGRMHVPLKDVGQLADLHAAATLSSLLANPGRDTYRPGSDAYPHTLAGQYDTASRYRQLTASTGAVFNLDGDLEPTPAAHADPPDWPGGLHTFEIRGPGGGVVLQTAGVEFGSAAEARKAGEQALAAYVADDITGDLAPLPPRSE